MPRLELKQIYLELEHEIKRLSLSTDFVYMDATRDDAHQVISEMRQDIDNWMFQLSERTIACYELESLLKSKRDQIQLQRLENKGVEKDQLESLKDEILHAIAQSIMNSYFNSLFRSEAHRINRNLKKEMIF
ncbi:MAG TPA: hypothetical protein VI413_01180 [Paludibacter sp.]